MSTSAIPRPKNIDDYSASPDRVIRELTRVSKYFIKKDPEDLNRETNLRKALETLGKDGIDEQVEHIAVSLKGFWANYASANIGELFQKFPLIEKAFYGLELTEEGGRYRDHFLHMFNCFILGARIISLIVSSKNFKEERDSNIERVFKVVHEGEIQKWPWMTQRRYPPVERLYFLWTHIATFHDIGIPVEHLSAVKDGLNPFYKHFGISLGDLWLTQHPAYNPQINYYIDSMCKLWNLDEGIELDKKGLYKRMNSPNPYIQAILTDELNKPITETGHGAVGSLCLLKSIMESHVRKWKGKYNFDTQEAFNVFTDSIFEMDIARCALVIALHDVEPEKYPLIFPLKFDKAPLLFLLILCDELQEYFRPEGISLRPIVKLKKRPKLEVEVVNCSGGLKISLKIFICYPKEIFSEQDKILKQIKNYYKSKNEESPPNKLVDYLKQYWLKTGERIKKKLSSGTEEPVHWALRVYVEERNSEPPTEILLIKS